MGMRFATLASGSRGNAAIIEAGGFGILIDAGLHRSELVGRLESLGAQDIRLTAALLSHTHGDHIRDSSLRWLARQGTPFYHHAGHRPWLESLAGFRALDEAGLLREYDDRPFLAPGGMRVEPVALCHDCDPTFGFRIEGKGSRRARGASLGYLADTGTWSEAVAEAVTDVDLLAVEFNHDVELQRRSGRPWSLIRRVLGPRGHLSNDQGAALVEDVLKRSQAGRVRDVVLLHLSRECNRPELAIDAAKAATARAGRRSRVIAAGQDQPIPFLEVLGRRPRAGSPPSSLLADVPF